MRLALVSALLAFFLSTQSVLADDVTSPLTDSRDFLYHEPPPGSKTEPKTLLVAFNLPSQSSLANGLSASREGIEAATAALQASGIQFTVQHEYNTLMNAVIIRFDTEQHKTRSIEVLKGVALVNKIRPAYIFEIPAHKGGSVSRPETDDNIGKDVTSAASAGTPDQPVSGDSSYFFTHTEQYSNPDGFVALSDSQSYPPVQTMQFAHIMTGMDKVHELGYFGSEEIRVCVIDSGVDYTHPALGGCTGINSPSPSCRIVDGVDLVGNVDAFNEEWQPSNDPMDRNGHGTHVAGIIAGKSVVDGFTGVAPRTSIVALKVTGGESASAPYAAVTAALEIAYQKGCRVVNVSLGSSIGFDNDDVLTDMIEKLAEANIVTVISAGNDGDGGLMLVGHPSTASEAISVASVDSYKMSSFALFTRTGHNDRNEHEFATTIGIGVDLSTRAGMNFTLSAVADDACDPVSDNIKFSADTLVLVKRGGCSFAVKLQNIKATGALGMVIEDLADRDSIVVPNTQARDPVVFAISHNDGQTIRLQLRKSKRKVLRASISSGHVPVRHPNRKYISSFSSWGLEGTLDPKPDVSAPGGAIVSTWLNGQYAQLSGTSQSSPYVSGMIALMLGRSPDDYPTVAEIRSQLLSSATPLSIDRYHPEYTKISAARQGSGIVDGYNVVYRDAVRVSRAHLQLNWAMPAAEGNPGQGHVFRQTIVLENPAGYCDVAYELVHEPAVFVSQLDEDGDLMFDSAPIEYESLGQANVRFPAHAIYINNDLQAYQSLELEIDAPADLPEGRMGFFSGYVVFKPSRVNLRNKHQFPPEDHEYYLQQCRTPLRVGYSGFLGDFPRLRVIDTKTQTRPVLALDTPSGLTHYLLDRRVGHFPEIPRVPRSTRARVYMRLQLPSEQLQVILRRSNSDGHARDAIVLSSFDYVRRNVGVGSTAVGPRFYQFDVDISTLDAGFYQVQLLATSPGEPHFFGEIELWVSSVFEVIV